MSYNLLPLTQAITPGVSIVVKSFILILERRYSVTNLFNPSSSFGLNFDFVFGLENQTIYSFLDFSKKIEISDFIFSKSAFFAF